jgi:riboflavin kinase/FMN adenylyltransferase
MQVHRNIHSLPTFKNAVITIGTFDGVHLGHRQIITQLKEEAQKVNGETVIITFHPHPRKVIQHNEFSVLVLNTLNEKIELLSALEINHLVIVPFDEHFANLSAEAYIERFLYKKFQPHTIIIGYDHRFGKDRKGDYHLLEAYAEKFRYTVKEIPEQVINHTIISSTRIREALLKGDIATAHEFLGYDYFFQGTVVEGHHLGNEIGYPTANLQPIEADKLIPGNGVYAVEVALQNSSVVRYYGMMNIGNRPTFNDVVRSIEVHIFNFQENIYGQILRVYIKYFLRKEKKFNGIEALKQQLHKDKKQALLLLTSPPADSK